MTVTKCFLCNSGDLKTVIDLGYHPLADTFLNSTQIGQPEIRYPLFVVACQDCGHLMNGYIVPAISRYQENEYSYDSSNSPVAISHFDELSKEVIEVVGVSEGDLVVDIGSNVGTLLSNFKANSNCSVVGIEPSKNIANIAEENGIKSVNDFFNATSVDKISAKAKAKVITGTNVYNHIEDQVSFAENINNLLTEEGSAVFEAPYAGTLIDETSFDTIYLEHASYFLVRPLKQFWAKFGFKIHKVDLNNYMGGSIRFYISRHLPESPEVAKLISTEESNGYFNDDTYKQFMERVVNLKVELMKDLYKIKNKNGKIIGIGAATKGNTLLNYCGIDSSLIEYVTDASPLKIGKFTPGTHLLIKDDKDIDKSITHGLILPWNIGNFLANKLKHLGLGFIVPHLK